MSGLRTDLAVSSSNTAEDHLHAWINATFSNEQQQYSRTDDLLTFMPGLVTYLAMEDHTQLLRNETGSQTNAVVYRMRSIGSPSCLAW